MSHCVDHESTKAFKLYHKGEGYFAEPFRDNPVVVTLKPIDGAERGTVVTELYCKMSTKDQIAESAFVYTGKSTFYVALKLYGKIDASDTWHVMQGESTSMMVLRFTRAITAEGDYIDICPLYIRRNGNYVDNPPDDGNMYYYELCEGLAFGLTQGGAQPGAQGTAPRAITNPALAGLRAPTPNALTTPGEDLPPPTQRRKGLLSMTGQRVVRPMCSTQRSLVPRCGISDLRVRTRVHPGSRLDH